MRRLSGEPRGAGAGAACVGPARRRWPRQPSSAPPERTRPLSHSSGRWPQGALAPKSGAGPAAGDDDIGAETDANLVAVDDAGVRRRSRFRRTMPNPAPPTVGMGDVGADLGDLGRHRHPAADDDDGVGAEVGVVDAIIPACGATATAGAPASGPCGEVAALAGAEGPFPACERVPLACRRRVDLGDGLGARADRAPVRAPGPLGIALGAGPDAAARTSGASQDRRLKAPGRCSLLATPVAALDSRRVVGVAALPVPASAQRCHDHRHCNQHSGNPTHGAHG